MKTLLAQAKIELTLTLRRGESVLVSIVVPAALLVFLSLADVIPTETPAPVDFFLPGTLAIAVMAAAMVSLGISTGYERHYRVLKRLGGTPLGRPSLIAAKTISVLAIEALQAVVLAVAALALLGWQPRGDPLGLALSLLLGTAAFAGAGLAMAGSLRAETNLAASNAAFVLLLLLGGSVFPLARLPPGLRATAAVLPAAPLAEAIRWSLSGGAAPGRALATLALWAIAAPLVAAATFSWE